jgi:Protein of unknown function (DUF4232)
MRVPIKFVPALAVVLALTAAGCGGGGNGGSTSTSGTATASSAAGPCRANDLRVKRGSGGVATGHELVGFILRNGSGGPCTLRGFPNVTLLDRSGRALGVTVKPLSSDFFGQLAVRTIAVPAGGAASFHLAFEVAINGGNCPTARSMRVTLPDGGAALRAALRNQLACPGGVTVSPLGAGQSGEQK